MNSGVRKWESAEDFFPPEGCIKHVPRSMLKDFDWARARRDNNALLALRWKKGAVIYGESSDEFDHQRSDGLDSIFLPKALATYVRCSMQEDYCVCPAKATTGTDYLSRLEEMPIDIVRDIRELLCNVDRVCLSFTSKRMMKAVLSDSPLIWKWYECTFELGMIPEEVWAHMELMARLRDWMPKRFIFCHHCLRYLPKTLFARSTTGMGYNLLCNPCNIDSRKISEPDSASQDLDKLDEMRVEEHKITCDGCRVYERVQEGLEPTDRYLPYGQKILWGSVIECHCDDEYMWKYWGAK